MVGCATFDTVICCCSASWTHLLKVFTTIASCIRKAFEKAYGRGWNVVVGRSFGAYVTHEIKTYMYLTVVPGVYVLLWRYDDPP